LNRIIPLGDLRKISDVTEEHCNDFLVSAQIDTHIVADDLKNVGTNFQIITNNQLWSGPPAPYEAEVEFGQELAQLPHFWEPK
jgi:hypothetical protein